MLEFHPPMFAHIARKFALSGLVLIIFLRISLGISLSAVAQPTVFATATQNNSYTIAVTFSESIPPGNIIDIELYNDKNVKVWQYFTTGGGNFASSQTANLSPGSYTIDVGLFTPNWASNYAWYDNLYMIKVAPSAPTIKVVPATLSAYTISVNFPHSIPSGDIVDLELHDASGQKVWQWFTANGGSSFSTTTSPLVPGSYTANVGLFTPNWANNYAWYTNLYSLTVGSPISTPTPTSPTTPTPTTVPQNSDVLSVANSSYINWKSKYVRSVDTQSARVIRPENNNDTVSEGIAYGMLLSYFADDRTTFTGLWKYAQKYLNANGLMDWQISSDGKVIGTGAATDADEDMAYALIRAENKWPGSGFSQGAQKLLTAILNTEISSSNLVKPGDSWTDGRIMNPSYLAPAFYREFARFTGNSRWNDIANDNLAWLRKVADQNTGLIPDWLNNDFSLPSIPWDQYPNAFYYDAARTPIRLLMDYKWNQNSLAQEILLKENRFVSTIGVSKLVSGYTLTNTPLTSYLDAVFLSAYTAMGQVNPSSPFASESLKALIGNTPTDYFGASLRTLTLYLIGGSR